MEQQLAQAQAQAENQEKIKAAEEKRQAMMRAVLSNEARERLGRIATVKPERARQVEELLLQAIQRGQLAPPVSEDTLKSVLSQLSEKGEGSQPTVTFHRKVAADDDW
eukprot:TRINITY_DN50_c0_g1_i1.p2 TRINITY_DN50_c0_g1~~TRINITY_DN50_c0_g1_i1.p2  ORF type:complete len:108 (-),score=17.43 TRINITY_DN50_c0_g1_i1:720-1043(-)